MAHRKITIQQLAKEADLDLDEVLIYLWDGGFHKINGPSDHLGRGEANRARRVLGLATRRELGASSYWQELFDVNNDGFASLLATLGVEDPFEGGQLRKRALNRLKAEARRRGLQSKEELDVKSQENTEQQFSPLVWSIIGHKTQIRGLDSEEILAIHYALVEDFKETKDPLNPPGIISRDLLESAAHHWETSIGGVQKYPTIEMAAAALMFALVHNHPFHNGNKRTALVAMLVFLDENGVVLTCNEGELFKLVLQLAQHALVQGPRHELPDREILETAKWLKSNSRVMEQGERPIKWRHLKQILNQFGCEFEFPSGVGNRINIRRESTGKTWLLKRKKFLQIQIPYADEGRDAGPGTIKNIRKALELDDDHGFDSRAFYERDVLSTSEFIIKYRKTLRRLARL